MKAGRHTNYDNKGCLDGLYPDCFKCPLPECRYEHGYNVKVRQKREERNKKILELVDAGMSQRDVARQIGVSRRTVQRLCRLR